MIETYILSHPWFPALVWLFLYTSDYYLTIWGAKLYMAQNTTRFEGSYELTPEYQDDVDNLRKLSPTFIIWLITVSVVLFLTGYTLKDIKSVYGFLIGIIIFPELGVHIRHFMNIVHFNDIIKAERENRITGQVLMPRDITYHRPSIDMLGLGVFTLIAYLLTNSSILLGGSIGICYLSYQHWRLYRKLRIKTNISSDKGVEK